MQTSVALMADYSREATLVAADNARINGNYEIANYYQMQLLIDQLSAISWQLKVFNDRQGNKWVK